MPLSDEFKKALQEGKIQEAFVLALSRAVELNITTWVATSEDDPDPTISASHLKPGDRLRTHINLIQGDIENEIGDRFVQDSAYQELRRFHFDQAIEGNHIISQNIQSLQQLFTVLHAIQHPNVAPLPLLEDVPPPLPIPPEEPTLENVPQSPENALEAPPEPISEQEVISPLFPSLHPEIPDPVTPEIAELAPEETAPPDRETASPVVPTPDSTEPDFEQDFLDPPALETPWHDEQTPDIDRLQAPPEVLDTPSDDQDISPHIINLDPLVEPENLLTESAPHQELEIEDWESSSLETPDILAPDPTINQDLVDLNAPVVPPSDPLNLDNFVSDPTADEEKSPLPTEEFSQLTNPSTSTELLEIEDWDIASSIVEEKAEDLEEIKPVELAEIDDSEWDEFALDSSPFEATPDLEIVEDSSEMEEDEEEWGDFLEFTEDTEATPSLEIPETPVSEEEWGDFALENDAEATPSLELPETPVEEEEWGDFALEDDAEATPSLEIPETPVEEEEWGDFALENDAEATPSLELPETPVEEEEWGDFAVGDDAEATPSLELPETPVEEEEWGDFALEDDAEATPSLELPETPVSEEEWGDFALGDDAEATPSLELPETPVSEEEWGDFSLGDDAEATPSLELPETPVEEEEWGDFSLGDDAEATPSLELPETPVSEEEWGDFALENDAEATPSLEIPETPVEEEEWGDFSVGDDAEATPSLELPETPVEEEEWGDFAVGDDAEATPSLELPETPVEEEEWGDFAVGDDAEATPSLELPETPVEEEEWGDFSLEDSEDINPFLSQGDELLEDDDFLTSLDTSEESKLEEWEDFGLEEEKESIPSLETPVSEEEWGNIELEETENVAADSSSPPWKSVRKELIEEPKTSEKWDDFVGEDESKDSIPNLDVTDSDIPTLSGLSFDTESGIEDDFIEELNPNLLSDDEEDWDDFMQFIEEDLEQPPAVSSPPPSPKDVTSSDFLGLEEETPSQIDPQTNTSGDSPETWGNWFSDENNDEFVDISDTAAETELDPFTLPELDSEELNVLVEEDWEEFTVDELQPYPQLDDMSFDLESLDVEAFSEVKQESSIPELSPSVVPSEEPVEEWDEDLFGDSFTDNSLEKDLLMMEEDLWQGMSGTDIHHKKKGTKKPLFPTDTDH
ncbi:hypothetical protein [Spirulina subsalsa]|uniref:hypothetical protein n=1 Tax=Spirulina subsalsa TaxID=54311 RepID=UPI000302545C|nr:hypothetical protein [Spirulina subsalsa]